jgi:hypothetical protein
VPQQGRANFQAYPEILQPGRKGVTEVVEVQVLDLGCLTGAVPLMTERIG